MFFFEKKKYEEKKEETRKKEKKSWLSKLVYVRIITWSHIYVIMYHENVQLPWYMQVHIVYRLIY